MRVILAYNHTIGSMERSSPSVLFLRRRWRAASVVVQVLKPPGHSSGMISKFP